MNDLERSIIFQPACEARRLVQRTERSRPKCEYCHFWAPFGPLCAPGTAETGRMASKTLPHSVPGWGASISCTWAPCLLGISLYWIVLHYIVLYSIVLHGISLYCTVLHSIELYLIVLHGIALYLIVLHCIALYCIVFDCIAWYFIVMHGIISYCIVLIVLHGFAWYFIVLYGCGI